MKAIHILRAGSHTDTHGTGVSFTDAQLREMAESYDPKTHEAPLTIGHPAGNAPAFGWVAGVEFSDGDLFAVPHQVHSCLSQMVRDGQFKKVSASIYMPGHPNNPTPGKPYLRHVGFLGAQPPAIKGLEPLQFAEGNDDGQVIEFEEQVADLMDMRWELNAIARFARGVREWFIDKHDTDTADTVVPSYLVEDLEEAARRPTAADQPVAELAEPTAPTEDDTVTEEELKALAAKLDAQEASFAERETAISAREAALTRGEHTAWADKMIGAGKLVPAERDSTINLLASMSSEPSVSFAEGEAPISPAAGYMRQVEARAPVVDMSERGGSGGGEPTQLNARQRATRIQDYVHEQRGKGNHVSFAEAAAHVETTLAVA